MKQKREMHIDMLKGMGIILVLMAHSCGFPGQIGVYLTASFMPVFFCASGMVYKAEQSSKEYVMKRFRKVIIPYLEYNIVLIFIAIIDGTLGNVDEIYSAVGGALYSSYCLYYPITKENNIFFYVANNNALWFLTALFCSSIVFDFIFKFIVKTNYILYSGLLVSACLLIGSKLLCFLPVFLPWNLDKAFMGAFFMLAGYFISCNRKIYQRWNISYTIITIVMAIIYILLCQINKGINMATRSYGSLGVGNVLCFAYIGVVGSVLWLRIFNVFEMLHIGHVLAYLGKKSMCIMAFHLVLFREWKGIYDRLQKGWDEQSWMHWGIALGQIAVAIVICLILDELMRKVMELHRRKRE